jgi:Flp pilus assembly protein TadD
VASARDLIAAGAARHGRGQFAEAVGLYRQAIAAEPSNAEARFNLGAALQAMGRETEAEMAYGKALALHPDFTEVHYNLGTILEARGDYSKALVHFERANALAPGQAAILNNLGGVLVDLGRIEEGVAALRRATATASDHPLVLWNLAKYGFTGANAGEARTLLARAATLAPAVGVLMAQLGIACALAGDEAAAAHAFAQARRVDPAAEAIEEGFRYIRERAPKAALCGSAAAMLRAAVPDAPAGGLVLEFGVFRGNSINQIAALTDREVHGFDTFEGLPEDWNPEQPRGTYSLGGVLPEVRANVRLHRGLFADTLPPFAARTSGSVAFAHVDCDLYSSTRDVFAALGDRMGAGTVLLFDEYLGYPGWRDHEWRAFQEFVKARGLRYDYLVFNVFGKQAAVRLAE